MPFEVVYKVPSGGYIDRERYLRKSELERFGEYDLVHFIRTKQFENVPNIPVQSEQYRQLRSSSLSEPLENRPVLGEQTDKLKLEEIVEVLIPVRERPHRFQPVFKMEYGTNVGTCIIGPENHKDIYPITDGLKTVEKITFDSEKMMGIALQAVEYLRQMGIDMKKIKLEQDTVYVGGGQERILAIGMGTTDWAYYPAVRLVVAGAGTPPLHLERELGLHELAEQFPLPLRNVTVEKLVQQGIAYNLDLQQLVQEGLSLAQRLSTSGEDVEAKAAGERLDKKRKQIIF